MTQKYVATVILTYELEATDLKIAEQTMDREIKYLMRNADKEFRYMHTGLDVKAILYQPKASLIAVKVVGKYDLVTEDK